MRQIAGKFTGPSYVKLTHTVPSVGSAYSIFTLSYILLFSPEFLLNCGVFSAFSQYFEEREGFILEFI